VHLNTATFFELVAQHAPSVVFLSCHRIHRFNDALPERLAAAGVDGVSFGRLALVDLLAQPNLLEFMAREKVHLPSPYPGVLPGYYLFTGGELLAYDTGLPMRTDVHHLLRGAAFGAVLYGTTGRAGHLVRALVGAANGAASPRVADGFARAVAARAAGPREARKRPFEPAEEELVWAYRTLGVAPNATDDEVTRAWRRLRVEHHPDHAASDEAEFARRTLRSCALNRARDVIFAHRAGRPTAA
jgi:hypothetical protein